MREVRLGRMRCVEIEAKSMINRVRGMGFGWSLNPYRGCAHDCVFCYARASHTFLKRDGVADWSTALSAKVNAPEVVRRELGRPAWARELVLIGTATDPYQPLEARYCITRRVLEEFVRAKSPASITTRSPLVLRDVDVLQRLAAVAGANVTVSLPTLDAALARRIEPTVAPPAQRLRTIAALAAAGIPTAVAVAPILPGITDDPAALRATYAAAAEAGASVAWESALRLAEVPRASYFGFLEREFPDLVARHERAFPGTNLEPGERRALGERVAAARAGIRFAPRPNQIAATRAGEQLALLA